MEMEMIHMIPHVSIILMILTSPLPWNFTTTVQSDPALVGGKL